MAKTSVSENKSIEVIENNIAYYKAFYKTHLKNVLDRDKAILDLKRVALTLKENATSTRASMGFVSAQMEVEKVLKQHFDTKLLDLYNKPVRVPIKDVNINDSILKIIGQSFVQIKEENRLQSKYEQHILNIILSCLLHFGLHPDIELRKTKSFNLLIKHKANSKSIVEDYMLGISFETLDKVFIKYFKNRKNIQLNGKIIPHNKIVEVKITSTKIKQDEIQLFFKKKNLKWSTKVENEMTFIHNCLDETNNYMPHPDEDLVSLDISSKYHETQLALSNYPSALLLFNEAIVKMQNPKLSRNALDDLRLCLETFLKEKFNSKKSLENQTQILGKFIKEKNGNTHVSDLYHKVIDFYSKYQNENVKHNNNVVKGDLNLISSLTSALIIHLSEL